MCITRKVSFVLTRDPGRPGWVHRPCPAQPPPSEPGSALAGEAPGLELELRRSCFLPCKQGGNQGPQHLKAPGTERAEAGRSAGHQAAEWARALWPLLLAWDAGRCCAGGPAVGK